jgi:glycosyltransferase involved in cell wall biosynthesis
MYGRLAYGYGLGRADLVICQNAYQSAQIRRNWRPRRIHTQHNVFVSAPGSAALRPRSARHYVAWLGVFRKPKNLPLLHAIAQGLPSIEIRVAGGSAGNVDAETARGLEGLRNLPNVRFVGYLKRVEVPDFLAGATALLCTSLYEGFSNTFLEAFSVGTPVVTRSGVDPDSIIANHALGRVAESDGRIGECIRQINEMTRSDFDDLAQRCRKYVEAHHAPVPILQKFAQSVYPLTAAARNR